MRTVVLDVEANGLDNPTKVWVVVCKDVDTGELFIFRRLSDDEVQKEAFLKFSKEVGKWIGHSLIEYDLPVLYKLIGLDPVDINNVVDTLIISRLVNYSRSGGHSIAQYGEEFKFPKSTFSDWTQYSQRLEDRCVGDVEISTQVYLDLLGIILDPNWNSAIALEQRFQLVVNDLHNNGFAFNVRSGTSLLERVTKELGELDAKIKEAFPPREQLIRVFTPKATKFGTISKTSVPRSLWPTIHSYEVGREYRHTHSVEFNPSSHKQLIEVLNEAGWRPEDKTTTHIDVERKLNRIGSHSGRSRGANPEEEESRRRLLVKRDALKITGWKINEQNLSTLPKDAPKGARLLAKRILLEARRRTLTEWLGLVNCEIKINKENVGCVGITRSAEVIQVGVKDSGTENVTGIKQSLKKLEECGKEEATTNLITDSLSKTFLEWLQSKKINAQFVKENKNFLWITVTGQEQLENFCASIATLISDGTKSSLPKYVITSERINGRFYGLGSWTGRMSHQKPNTANIPTAVQLDGSVKLLGKELRSLWIAPNKKILVGVDAEGIQLRIFAHYIQDEEFTDALVKGRKEDKTDPHSLNQRILGSVCKSREAAKRFVYALLLGGGLGKLAVILGCSQSEAREALDRLLERYQGFARLKKKGIPKDAERGCFEGLDGRLVPLPGETQRDREHLCMSGYLQNGEAIIIKRAAIGIDEALHAEKLLNKWMFCDIVHDEYVMECRNDMFLANRVKKIASDAIKEAGEYYNLRCPLAGSGDTGLTWFDIH